MASIEFIQTRIEGKNKEITKLEKKLERINKAKATNWEVNPYYYHESDLKWTTRDLEEAKKGLEKYLADLATETEKANSRDVAVILEFLEGWKQRVTEFYNKRFEKFPEAKREYDERINQFPSDWRLSEMVRKDWDKYHEMWEDKKALKENFHARFGCIAPYVERCYNPETECYDSWSFDSAKLAKELEQEANRKYDFIIERTNAIAGTIKDAGGLEIGAKGDLNGFIIGERGIAKVQTIGAGGYNIQCFHFRTLINKVGA